MKSELKVTVDYLTYQNDKNWCILKTNIGEAVGVVPWKPKVGDALILSGLWVPKSNGSKQFKFSDVSVHVETDPRSLLTLACSTAKGFGEKKAEAIWETYGADWLNHPGLEQVSGISSAMYNEWSLVIERISPQREQYDTTSYLMGKGCTMTMANAAWKEWEDETLGIVNDNCYRLCELPHFGFSYVDEKVRQNFGITDRDPRRLDACILYVLKEATGRGDTVANLADLHGDTKSHIPVTFDQFEESVKRLVEAEYAVLVNDSCLSLFFDYQYEINIYNLIKAA